MPKRLSREHSDSAIHSGRLGEDLGRIRLTSSAEAVASTSTAVDHGEAASSASSTPPYLAWSRSLDAILNDFDGLHLFKKFLRKEECLATIHFYFSHKALQILHRELEAAAGKGEEAELVANIKKLTYDMDKSFLRNASHELYIHPALAVPQALRDDIHRVVREKTSQLAQCQTLFQPALDAVVAFLQNKHSQFVMDEVYIKYIQEADQGAAESGGESVETKETPPPPLPPRLHPPPKRSSRERRKLDWKLLESTASARVAASAAAADSAAAAPHPYHSAYVARLPPSTQDSELASSDADSFTLPSARRIPAHYRAATLPSDSAKAQKHMQRQQSSKNHEANAAEKFIPRTQAEGGWGSGCGISHATAEARERFFVQLSAKLEAVALKAEAEERLLQCLRDLPDQTQGADLKRKTAAQTAAAIHKHHALLEGDECGDILDAHLNHINWDDSKKQTPTNIRSPVPLPAFPHFPYPQPSSSTFRTLPDRSRRSPSARSPERFAHPPPPLPQSMTASFPATPSAHHSSLIRPLNWSSSKGKASPGPHRSGRGRAPNPATLLLNRASDTSGIESGSSSNPSLVSAFHPHLDRPFKPPQLTRPTPSSAEKKQTGGGGSLSRRGRRTDVVLVYSLPDEEVPYAVACAAADAAAALTLKDVKAKLPRRNQDPKEFKYFFKCRDAEEAEVWREVEADSAPVPLWNSGKILAKITHQ